MGILNARLRNGTAIHYCKGELTTKKANDLFTKREPLPVTVWSGESKVPASRKPHHAEETRAA